MAAMVTQDVNPSLPPWNYALSYGLILVLAIAGVPAALRRRRPADLLALSWLAAAVVLLYVPSSVQRRFITGLHVPLVILAAMGLEQVIWPRLAARRLAPAFTSVIVGVTTLTSFFVPLVAVAGVAQGRAPLVMSSDEAVAWSWLKTNTTWTDTVLAPVDTGQFIPAWAGNRVVYGHPLEAIDAEAKKAEVARFYGPDATTAERRALLERYGVQYVFLSTRGLGREGHLGQDMATLGLVQVWARGNAALYQMKAAP
jgi:asparagine N-glycosylation enzyme membrane subunit Stt3